MKRNVKFVLKNKNAKNSTAIYMIYSWGYKSTNSEGRKVYTPLKYSTKQSVNPAKWKDEKATGSYSSSINSELATIKAAADSIFIKYQDDDLTPSLLKKELDIKLGRIEKESKPKINSKKVYVHDYISQYIKEIETGARRTFKDPIKRMAPGTIRNIRAFRTKFTDYETETGKQYTFNDIDMKFYRHFIAWLDGKHTINSAGKTIKQLKTIMQAALDDNVHRNIEFKKKSFKVVSELVDTIYLNDEEVKKLYLYKPTKPYLELARDLFLIGCFTLQRVSDWPKINNKNIKKSVKGTKIITLKQQKTKTTVVIPLVDPWLIAILEKYNMELPKMPESKINKYIKEVCKAVGITDKADRVTTHTARRTGCTNMYNAGIPIKNIMKISGHKTESEFRKYIRVTEEESAEDIAKHDFFKRLY